jgi:hypothetical protein
MDLSVPAYFVLGPGLSLLTLELLFPPFVALYHGQKLGLGRSFCLVPPDVLGIGPVSVNWSALAIECVLLLLCIGISYWTLSRAEPMWARQR